MPISSCWHQHHDVKWRQWTLHATSRGSLGFLELCAESIEGHICAQQERMSVWVMGSSGPHTSGLSSKCHVSSWPSVDDPCLALSPLIPINGYLSWFQVFSSIATLLYVEHAWFSLIRWKWFSLRRKKTSSENPDGVN